MSHRIKTGGNVEVQNIKVGDIHYEYAFGIEMKVIVQTAPIKINEHQWAWEARTEEGEVVDYLVTEGLSHYAPKLYDYQAYVGGKFISK